MSGVTGNLVSQSLRLDNGDFGCQSLVSFKVQGQLWIETFNHDLGSSLNGFSSNATLDITLVFQF